MLRIENGRFSECVFVEDMKNRRIALKKYRDQESEVKGLIVGVFRSENAQKVWIDIDGYPNVITSFYLHCIQDASIV